MAVPGVRATSRWRRWGVVGAAGAAGLAVAFGLALLLGNAPPVKPLRCHVFGLGCPELIYSGFVKPGWEPVIAHFRKNFDGGHEVGAQLSVFHQNEAVVDVVLGYADTSFTTPFANDTLQIIFSCTKVVEALVIAMLVDRGLVRYEDRIAQHWPEFAQGGKENVTVGDLMSHAGGVPHVSRPISLADFHDHRRGGRVLADLLAATELDPRAFRQAGTQGYHGFSRGFYTSQLCRRVDPRGRNIDEFARDEIVQPLHLDFRIGIPDGSPLWKRVGPILQMSTTKIVFGLLPKLVLPAWASQYLFHDDFMRPLELQVFKAWSTPGTVTYKAAYAKVLFAGDVEVPVGLAAEPWGSLESPSTHGFTTGHTMGRIAQVLANGGVDPVTGTVLLSKATLDRASEFYPYQFDSSLLDQISYTRGGWGQLSTGAGRAEEIENKCLGWIGAGGAIAQWCPEAHLAIGYVMNYYNPGNLEWRGKEYLTVAMQIATGGARSAASVA